jgi:hypothetical protein
MEMERERVMGQWQTQWLDEMQLHLHQLLMGQWQTQWLQGTQLHIHESETIRG